MLIRVGTGNYGRRERGRVCQPRDADELSRTRYSQLALRSIDRRFYLEISRFVSYRRTHHLDGDHNGRLLPRRVRA